MKFTISTSDLRTLVAVLWFANSKCENNIKHHFFVGECVYHDADDNDLVDFIGYDNEFIFNYKDIEIKLTRKREGNAVFINSRCEAGHFEEITLEILSDIDDQEKIKFMKNFIINVKEAYKENKRLKNTNEKIFLWSYCDGFWDNIKKINKRKLKTVILDQNIKKDIEKYIENYNNKDLKKRLNDLGHSHKMNIILSGLPGTGKSSLMYSLASTMDKDIATIDFHNSTLSDHAFISATNKIPENSIFVLEDIDALYIERNKNEGNRVSYSCILNFLDGVYSKDDLITIITTNHIEKLDKALIRPMRMDHIVKFTYCSKYQYEEIFKLIFPEKLDIMDNLYKIIKSKKFTTSILQKYLIKFIFEPEKLLDNIKIFEEYIDSCLEKSTNMFT
jgi:AAA+ superfamily predicted ATPase